MSCGKLQSLNSWMYSVHGEPVWGSGDANWGLLLDVWQAPLSCWHSLARRIPAYNLSKIPWKCRVPWRGPRALIYKISTKTTDVFFLLRGFWIRKLKTPFGCLVSIPNLLTFTCKTYPCILMELVLKQRNSKLTAIAFKWIPRWTVLFWSCSEMICGVQSRRPDLQKRKTQSSPLAKTSKACRCLFATTSWCI